MKKIAALTFIFFALSQTCACFAITKYVSEETTAATKTSENSGNIYNITNVTISNIMCTENGMLCTNGYYILSKSGTIYTDQKERKRLRTSD